MADAGWSRERYGEAFWRAHHESWQQSDLNQREYCEAHVMTALSMKKSRTYSKSGLGLIAMPLPYKIKT